MVLFQYGVALHELETERIRTGEITLADKRDILEGIWRKTKRQVPQGLRCVPTAGRSVCPIRLRGQPDRQPARNIWSYVIIFCGHFPRTQEFSVEETENESAAWYFRQVLGSANLTGGKLFTF